MRTRSLRYTPDDGPSEKSSVSRARIAGDMADSAAPGLREPSCGVCFSADLIGGAASAPRRGEKLLGAEAPRSVIGVIGLAERAPPPKPRPPF